MIFGLGVVRVGYLYSSLMKLKPNIFSNLIFCSANTQKKTILFTFAAKKHYLLWNKSASKMKQSEATRNDHFWNESDTFGYANVWSLCVCILVMFASANISSFSVIAVDDASLPEPQPQEMRKHLRLRKYTRKAIRRLRTQTYLFRI